MRLGENISQIRKEWKLSQNEFGDYLSMPGHRIAKYESGENYPRLEALLRLEEITGIPIYELCIDRVELSRIPDKPLEEYVLKGRIESDDNDNELRKQMIELQQKYIQLMEEIRILEKENKELKKKQ